MRDYEEKSYYEIQLDNKQLILVFLAAVTVCVLIFVLGVMIGKGQKEAEIAATTRSEKNLAAPESDVITPQQPLTDVASEAQAEEKSVPQETVKKTEPAKEPERKEPERKEPVKTASVAEKPQEKYAYEDLDKAEQEPVKEKEKPPAAEPLTKSVSQEEKPTPAVGAQYTVQVMATSSKPKAQEQVSILKSRGYSPYMDETKTGDTSVFKVRVGKFADTQEAKAMASKIKSDLKLETWVAVLD